MNKPSRPKRDVHGWVVLDKPLHMTSTQAVGAVRRLFQAKKGGHAGTLDPLASGILPIALGEATKTVPYVTDSRKVYRFEVSWGSETTTDDREGEITNRSDKRPTPEEIAAILPRYLGHIEQVPPQFSAIKIDGERAYDLARDGEEFTIAARTIVIDRLIMVECDADKAVFEAECGKGTYVRALARDFGRDLGCFGHVSALRRTQVGPFHEDEAVTLDELTDLAEGRVSGHGIEDALEPVSAGLQDLPEVALTTDQAARLRRGQSVIIRGRDAPIDGMVSATCAGEPVAIGEVGGGELQPRRIFML